MIRWRFIFILSIIILGLQPLSSQTWEVKSGSKKAVKYYHEAESAYKQMDYQSAEEYLKKAIGKDKHLTEAWLLLGDVHTELGKQQDAVHDFEQAVAVDSTFFPRAFYFLGNLNYDLGNYSKSVNYYKKYLLFQDEDPLVRILASQKMKTAVFAKNAVSHPVCNLPENIGDSINTKSDEYINFVNEDVSFLVFTRKEIVQQLDNGQKLFSENFYKSLKKSGKWDTPEPVAANWPEGLDKGGMTLSIDSRKMYFTGCNWPEGLGSCDLYVSSRRGHAWLKPVNLGRHVNSSGWDSQPVVSADGKRLFFASKRKGGRGGSDIWMSLRLKNGKWSPPVNLGDSINTPGDEMSPFLHADGKTLYFSSTGHRGLGKADLYVSHRDEAGRWSKAENLGYPVNSRFDDLNIFVGFDGTRAWISSNREGGQGGFDIYRFDVPGTLQPQKVFFVKGIVKDKETGKKLAARVELTDLLYGTVADSTVSDAVTGEFLMVLQPGTNYAFHIFRKGYLFYSENFNLNDSLADQSVRKIFLLERLKPGRRITLNNIFFDFDKATLKPASSGELDKVVELLKTNPGISIQINGYTDNIGTDEYNLDLSTRRAKAVYNYLMEQGIAPDRLAYKGFGATQPVAGNETEKGRAQNRRTEIVIK